MLMTGGVRADKVLDLTDSQVRKALNIDETQLTLSTGNRELDYAYTQQISRKAYEAGYSGVIYPSAQRASRSNLVLFGGRYDPAAIEVINRQPAKVLLPTTGAN